MPSAGEEDFGHPEITTSLLPKVCLYKGIVLYTYFTIATITLQHVRICMWKPQCCCHCPHSSNIYKWEKKWVLSVTSVTKMPSIRSVTNKILEINLWRKLFMLVCSGPALTLIRLQQHSYSNLQNWCCYLPVVHLQGRWPEMTACTQTAAAMQTKKSAPHTDNTYQLCLSCFS